MSHKCYRKLSNILSQCSYCHIFHIFKNQVKFIIVFELIKTEEIIQIYDVKLSQINLLIDSDFIKLYVN